MESNNEKLLDLIGGNEAISAVVDVMYQKVMSEPQLAVFFEGVDMELQREHMKRFLQAAFDTRTFDSKVLQQAHGRLVKSLELKDFHFDGIKRIITETLLEFRINQELIEEVADMIESMRTDVLHG